MRIAAHAFDVPQILLSRGAHAVLTFEGIAEGGEHAVTQDMHGFQVIRMDQPIKVQLALASGSRPVAPSIRHRLG